MSNIANPFEKPVFSVSEYDDTKNYGRFVVGPLERGFGLTVGNALRRVLLSSLQEPVSSPSKSMVFVMSSPRLKVWKKT